MAKRELSDDVLTKPNRAPGAWRRQNTG